MAASPTPARTDALLGDERITQVGMLMEAHAALAHELDVRLAARCGFPHTWFEVLLRLGRSPDHRLRMGELAVQIVSVTPSGLTRLVERIVAAGLVERIRCDEDRRGAWAQLTPAGLEQLELTVADHLADLDDVYTGVLDPTTLATVTDAMRTVRDHLAATRPPVPCPGDAESSSP